MHLTEAHVHDWLQAFASAVRARDFDAGRALFDSGCIGFGTVSVRAADRRMLEAEQWNVIWPVTIGFEFNPADVEILIEDPIAVVMARWRSQREGDVGPVGLREGRATIILRNRDEGLMAVHTHFSRNPSPRVA